MSLRHLLAIATLCSLTACDPALTDADDPTPRTDATAATEHPTELAPSCAATCATKIERRCNGDSMGHCSRDAARDELFACIVEECDTSEPNLDTLDALLPTTLDPTALSMCANVCKHYAELEKLDCTAGNKPKCDNVYHNSFNICYFDECCSTWDQMTNNCFPPKV